MTNDGLIVDKIERFIRKYYKNLLIRGALYSIALLLSLFLLVVALEHFGYFGTTVRTVLFWLYVGAMVYVVGRFVVSPLLKMHRIGPRLSYAEAARIIGQHFPEVKDKLLNLLQLQQQGGEATTNTLLQAAIEQKTQQLSPVPFVNAVNLRGNRKYVKYAAVPLLVILLLLVVKPRWVTEPSHRLLHHTDVFERPAPFRFVVENDALRVVQLHDFVLSVAVEGDALPAEAYVEVDGVSYKMERRDASHFNYLFKSVRSTLKFRLQGGGVGSTMYELTVLPAPSVVDFSVALSYPAHTGKAREVVHNVGDLSVPEGTRVEWTFATQSVDTLRFFAADTSHLLEPQANGRVSHAMRVMQTMPYGFAVSNRSVAATDTLQYVLNAVPDAVPQISVVELRDSLVPDRVFFKGRIKDDYGFSRLAFRLRIGRGSDPHTVDSLVEIGVASETSQEFYYSTSLQSLPLRPGDEVAYYFEVWDNDGVRGPKSAVSQTFEWRVPTQDEVDHLLDSNRAEAEKRAESSLDDLRRLQKEIERMMERLVDKRDLNWQDKQQLQELRSKQQEVREQLRQMQEQLKQNNRLEQQYREQNEQIVEKQRELDKLMQELLTDEMKDVMEQIDKLMQQIDKQKVQEQLDVLKSKNEELERQLDQDLELMRRLEMEKRVDQAVQKAEQLSQEQKELADQTERASQKADERQRLETEQQRLSAEFEKLRRDVENIQQEYKQMDPESDFKVDKELMQRIEKNQKGAKNKLQQGQNDAASEQQRQAAEDLDKLSEELAEAQMEMEQGELAEDAEQVRHLLRSLVSLSFSQENLITQANSIYIQDPKYQELIVDQNKIKADFRSVHDSLQAMSRRQIAVATAVNKELEAVNSNISRSLNDLVRLNQTFYGGSKNLQASTSMQYSMMSFNNLALILAESLDKMQNQMRQNQQQKQNGSCKRQGKKQSSGSCSKPGTGKPSPKSMKEMQEALNRQMESLKKQLEQQGSKPDGRTKIGQDNGMSETFARMAAQQEQIRRMMQEYGQEMKQQNAGNAKLAQEIEELMRQMEQTETDLVNRTLTRQTLLRQQQIMTRLLEHEKAELQQERDERRQSNEGKELFQPSPGDLQRLEQLQKRSIDLFRSAPPALSPFYKSKVENYFYHFNL